MVILLGTIYHLWKQLFVTFHDIFIDRWDSFLQVVIGKHCESVRIVVPLWWTSIPEGLSWYKLPNVLIFGHWCQNQLCLFVFFVNREPPVVPLSSITFIKLDKRPHFCHCGNDLFVSSCFYRKIPVALILFTGLIQIAKCPAPTCNSKGSDFDTRKPYILCDVIFIIVTDGQTYTLNL